MGPVEMKKRAMLRTCGALSLIAFFVLPGAQAHSGHGFAARTAFLSGSLHPLSGLDHLLAMISVGLWAAQLGGRAVWLIPGAFVATMLVGAGLGLGGASIPLVEAGIACSVLILGLLIASAARLPVWVGGLVTGAFALFHGHAHGNELAAGLSANEFLVGMALTTAALHAVGIGLGVLLARGQNARWLRPTGGAIAICGLVLLATRV